MYHTVRIILFAVVLAVALPAWPTRAAAAEVVLPVERYFERQTLKGFDVLVDRAYHERHRDLFPHNGFRNQFTGIHAGADVEFGSAADGRRDVPVKAVADGEIIYVGDVPGYGGLVIVRHHGPETVTSLYGHVRLRDAPVRSGQRVAAGQTIALLGKGFSAETSGARKHLHFGIHKGPALDVAGHEQTRERLLAEWYNPNDWLVRHGAALSPRPAAAPAPSPSPEPAVVPDTPKETWFTRLIAWFRDFTA